MGATHLKGQVGAASQCIAWPIWRTSRQDEGDGEDDLAEALRGVNPFRRLLGVAVLAWLAFALVRLG